MIESTRAVLADRLQRVEDRIATACARAGRARDSVTLVAVTKTVSPAIAKVLGELDVSDLAENRPQELWNKRSELPRVRWHLIGHLQRNKIRATVPVKLIHSVDSMRLLAALEAEGVHRKLPIDCLLQINVAGEPTKQGFAPAGIGEVIQTAASLKQVRIAGLMTMAPFDNDPERSRSFFADLREISHQWRGFLPAPHQLITLSMGMTQDFEVAIEEGASMVRLGSALFADLA